MKKIILAVAINLLSISCVWDIAEIDYQTIDASTYDSSICDYDSQSEVIYCYAEEFSSHEKANHHIQPLR